MCVYTKFCFSLIIGGILSSPLGGFKDIEPLFPQDGKMSTPGGAISATQLASADPLLPISSPITSPNPQEIMYPSQVVTSLEPQATICPITASSGLGPSPIKRQVSQPSAWPLLSPNGSLITPDSSPVCTVAYARKVLSLCNTIITRLGDLPITVTDCEQKITFRTGHGLLTLRGGPQELQTTNYIAPWTDVVTGVPHGIIQAEVCGGSWCQTYNERWETSAVVVKSTTTSTININTILAGV